MIEYIGLNENNDYVFMHETKGKMTVGKWTATDTTGATNEEHAYTIAEHAYSEMGEND